MIKKLEQDLIDLRQGKRFNAVEADLKIISNLTMNHDDFKPDERMIKFLESKETKDLCHDIFDQSIVQITKKVFICKKHLTDPTIEPVIQSKEGNAEEGNAEEGNADEDNVQIQKLIERKEGFPREKEENLQKI